MSFAFRSAEENFLNLCPSSVSELFLEDAMNDMAPDLHFLRKFFAYSLTNKQKEYVVSRGIRLSCVTTETHPHPVSKIFENHMLFNIFPRFIHPDFRVVIFSIKESKAEYLYQRVHDNFDVVAVNRYMTATDKSRYHGASVINNGRNNFDGFIAELARRFAGNTPDVFFFHDELMYWTKEMFVEFLVNVQPKQVCFTFVFPVEALFGKKESYNTNAYSFEYMSNDQFAFYPDGAKCVPYLQSLKNGWPFEINRFEINVEGRRKTYNLDLVEYHGAHFFFSLSECEGVTQDFRTFKDFNCMDLSDDCIKSNNEFSCGIARTEIVQKVFSYFTCLKKKDVESALAKLRQLTESKLLNDELCLIHDLSLVLSKTSMDLDSKSFISYFTAESTLDFIFDQCSFLSKIFGNRENAIKKSVRLFSKRINSLSLKLPTKPYHFSDTTNLRKVQLNLKRAVRYIYKNSEFNMQINRGGLNLTINVQPVIQAPRRPSHEEFENGGRILRMVGLRNLIEPEVGENEAPSVEGSESTSPTLDNEGEREDEREETREPLLNRNEGRNGGGESSLVNNCFFVAVATTVKKDPNAFRINCMKSVQDETVRDKIFNDQPLTIEDMEEICRAEGIRVWVYMSDEIIKINDSDDLRVISIGGRAGHLFKIDNFNFFQEYTLLESAYYELYGLKPIPIVHAPDPERVQNLFNSFLTMNSGGLINKRMVQNDEVISKDRIKSCKDCPPSRILPFVGFAGSGKSRSLFKLVKDRSLEVPFIWISPRANVLNDMKVQLDSEYGEAESVNLKNCFVTFEVALLKKDIPNLVVVDEVSLLPPGYIDMLMAKHNKSLSIAVLGDSLQCSYHGDDRILLHKNTPELVYYIQKAEVINYLYFTYRFGKSPFFPSLSNNGGDFEVKRGESPLYGDYPILCASQKNVRELRNRYPTSKVMTIGEAQGCTFNYVNLYMSDDLNLADTGTVITGLTRARNGLCIVVDRNKVEFFLRHRMGTTHCAAIMGINGLVIDTMCKPFLNSFNLIRLNNAGHDYTEKLEGDPFLKSEMSLVGLEGEIVQEVEVVNEFLPCQVPKVHVPLAFEMSVDVDVYSKMKAREFREFFDEGIGWSAQFDDTILPRAEVNVSPAMNYQNIFPRHKANDSVTFMAAVKKRIFFSNPGNQMKKYMGAKEIGKTLLKVFLKHVKIDPSVDENMMVMSKLEFEDKKMSKPAALIANHAIRSDTDWKDDSVFLFMKSQLCKKIDKMYSTAKAGQTLACFSHRVLCRFSPVSRYIEKKVTEALPEKFYIHQKKDFCELEEWVKRGNFSGFCTESDYEAFDASQDHIALAFEVELMKYLGFDADVIEDYIWIKTHLNCKLGEFAIMRFTGEFCTFLFNTLVNMVFTFIQYEVGNARICFAGDDMSADQALKKRKDFDYILDKMSLKAKVQVTNRPTFCGWRLSRYGIVKSPELMHARLMVAIYKGELELVLDSYFLEFTFSYLKKEFILDILDEKEMEHHYFLTRFFVKNRCKLKGEARKMMDETAEEKIMMFGECFGNDSIRSRAKDVFDKYSNFVKERLCQSSMSRNSSSLHLDQVRSSTLMELTRRKFTTILEPLSPKSQMLSKGSNQKLKFQLKEVMELSQLRYHYLMKQKLKLYQTKGTISHSYITPLSCFQSQDSFLQLEKLRERCTCLMVEELGWRQQSRRAFLLTCQSPIWLITCIAQTTWSQLLIPVSGRALSLGLSSVGFILTQAHRASSLMLESCTDYSTTWMSQCLKIVSNNLNTRSLWLVTNFLTCKMLYPLKSSKLYQGMSLRMLELRGCFTKEVLARELLELVKKSLDLGNTGLNLLLTKLGLVLKGLKEICIDLLWLTHFKILLWSHPNCPYHYLDDTWNMSARTILENKIRTELMDYLFRNIVDKENVLQLNPAVGVALTQAQKEKKDMVMSHFMKNLMGNIAIQGASDKVNFLNMRLEIPVEFAKQTFSSDQGVAEEQQAPFVISYVLSDAVATMKTYRDTNVHSTIQQMTFRQICRPFANHAMDFLLENPNERTNLYWSQPHNYQRAPEVAFDFADGLSINRVGNNKDRQFVLSALAARTFNHEAKKSVFEAQGAVNFTFDG